MNRELNSVFQDFTKSTFAMADKRYEKKLNRSYLEAAFESSGNVYMDSVLPSIGLCAGDDFLEEAKWFSWQRGKV